MALSAKRAQQLAEAMAEAKATKIRRDLLIAAALKAGASTREVAAVIGLSPVQVSRSVTFTPEPPAHLNPDP